MKRCPHCMDAPSWHFASNTTRKRADGVNYYFFTGCRHAQAFAKTLGMVRDPQREGIAKKWDDEAERLFAVATERWTEPERARFALRLGHVAPVLELELQADNGATADSFSDVDASQGDF